MKTLIFATGNAYKVMEVRQMLKDLFEIKSLKDIGFEKDIPEPHDTLNENALEKARVVYKKFGLDCFSEDTGLEIEVLNGAPGVKSARYAGEDKSSEANIDLVLENLEGRGNRIAQFRTVIALILDDKEYLFEGIVTGKILTKRKGAEGFGYDPIFLPDGSTETFAEMGKADKNAISHRGRAIKKLVDFLAQYNS